MNQRENGGFSREGLVPSPAGGVSKTWGTIGPHSQVAGWHLIPAAHESQASSPEKAKHAFAKISCLSGSVHTCWEILPIV